MDARRIVDRSRNVAWISRRPDLEQSEHLLVPSRPAISIREKELHERRNVTGKRQVHIDETETRKSSGI
jgi:hypothetical protein